MAEKRTTYKIQDVGGIGEVKIADEVVAMIAGLAATEVEGVASMGGNITNELVSKLGMKSLSKGTKEKVQLVLTMSRRARLYLLDEPIGGVDPAARDYILDTILSNYRREATVLISTHLIADLERIVDQVVLMQDGRVRLCAEAAQIREENGCSVDAFFREVYRC